MAVAVDILLYVLGLLAMVIGGPTVIYWSYLHARKKGYRPPAAAVIAVVGVAAGIAGTVALHIQNTTGTKFLWLMMWVPLLLSTAALGILVHILPQRTVRVFGERRSRFPLRVLGWFLKVVGVLIVALVALTLVSGAAAFSALAPALPIGIILWATGRYLIREAKSLHAPPPAEVLKTDQRAPVLYLRAFNQETQFFVMGTKGVYGKWAKSFHAEIATGGQKIGLTIEEYLAQELHDSIGPFVALGSPEDYLAPPGALRIYAKDDEWRARFDELARRAACVIVEVSESDNLRWEFEHLRAEGLQEKLFVVTSLWTKVSRIPRAYWGMMWRIKGIRTMTWQEFTTDLTKLGYQIKFDDPGAGSVFAFDAKGKGFVLTTEGNWPEDFVDPIRSWIVERKKVGRCVDSKCVKCGYELYAFATDTGPLCDDCRAKAPGAKRGRLRSDGAKAIVLLIVLPALLAVLGALLLPEAWADRWFAGIYTGVYTMTIVLAVVVVKYRSWRKKDRAESTMPSTEVDPKSDMDATSPR